MDTIKSTIHENIGGPLAQKLAKPEHKFTTDDVPSQTGKVAVVTGGSEGIGYGVTHTLLSKGISKIFILSMSKEVVDGAQEALSKDLGADAARKTTWLQCDLADWSRVKDVAEQIKKHTDRIDILVNNAARGIMTYQLSDLGVDRHMAVNHFGHVILTSHLLPVLKDTASKGNTVRIVNTSSNLHPSVPADCKFASLDELNQDLGPNSQYGRAKLAAILYSRYLARHLTSEHPNILVNAIHPGLVRTKMSTQDIHEPFPLGGYGMSAGMAPFQKDQFEGAQSTLFAATTTDKSGQYICPPATPEDGSKQSQDPELAESLMKLTLQVIKEKTRSESAAQGCPLDKEFALY